MLRKQYRMAGDIMALANKLVYGDQLLCGSAAVAEAALQLPRSCDPGLPPWLREVGLFGLALPYAGIWGQELSRTTCTSPKLLNLKALL